MLIVRGDVEFWISNKRMDLIKVKLNDGMPTMNINEVRKKRLGLIEIQEQVHAIKLR